jgi:hypothetical protein
VKEGATALIDLAAISKDFERVGQELGLPHRVVNDTIVTAKGDPSAAYRVCAFALSAMGPVSSVRYGSG